MANLCFDFSLFNQEKHIKRAKNSDFFRYLEEHDLTLEYYVKEIFSKASELYISCASINRDPRNTLEGDIYQNYFVRIADSPIMFQTDIIIGASIKFLVKNALVNKYIKKNKYELKLKCTISSFLGGNTGKSDINLVRQIISQTPAIGDEKGRTFLNDWDSYLEFERSFFYNKIGYYKTNDYRVLELIEVKRDKQIKKEYSEELYFDDGSNYMYFIKDEVPFNGDSLFVVEFESSIKKDEFNKFASFVKEDIEITSPVEALDEKGKLKNNTVSDLEFSFTTRRLGSLAKSVEVINENENTLDVTFSKFWVGDEIYIERINEKILTLCGEKPLLVNILTGDVTLYKRGKQALMDLYNGNVKNPALLSYLMNIEEYDHQDDIISLDNIAWANPNLDEYQKNAIFKALNSHSTFLIQGPPGTGKTQVISELVYQLNKLGKKVLLSSQTHVAIDNALDRLPPQIDILPIRLTNNEKKVKSTHDFLPDKIVDNLYYNILTKYKSENSKKHADLLEKSINFLNKKLENIEQDRIDFSNYLLVNNANVFGITCNANSSYLSEKNDYLQTLGLGNINLRDIDFDVTIIDEVSKATPVELLIPILYSKSIILVGDHRQLPPTFKYKEKMFEENKDKKDLAKYQDMVEDSLFASLFDRVKNNKAILLNQYRSHSQIVDVINTFYDGQLNIPNIAEQNNNRKHYLKIPGLFSENAHTYWINSHLDSNGEIAYEKKLLNGNDLSSSFVNENEIDLIEKCLLKIDEYYSKHADLPALSIGIISLYGDQMNQLRKRISRIKFKAINIPASKISTVDEFQGKEEDIIFVSLVRNNKVMQAGEFTKKYQRINVALSRAKNMLVIVGSKEFFTQLDVPIKSNITGKEEHRKVYGDVYQKCVGKIDEPYKELEGDL